MRAHVLLNEARRRASIWFWKPQWHWFGWKTLIPVTIGHDQYARRTLCLGWTVTGRVIIPIGYCRSSDCLRQALVDILAPEQREETMGSVHDG